MANAALTELTHNSMPFMAMFDLEIVSGSPDEVVATATWSADRCTVGGALHGGFLMSMADGVAGLCAFLNLPEGASTSTIESKTNFFRAVTEGDITITSTPLHVGRTTVVIQTDVTRADGKAVTRTTQTQAVIA